MSYECSVCGHVYDENTEGTPWSKLTPEWSCPICESDKDYFNPVGGGEDSSAGGILESSSGDVSGAAAGEVSVETSGGAAEDSLEIGTYLKSWARVSDDHEQYLDDIQTMAKTGTSIIEPMRTRKPVVSWDDILILGAQLARLPLDKDVPVNTQTVIGPGAKQPMVLETPVYVSHMSFGALSREIKIALATGSAAVKTAMCSGEGGILPEEKAAAYKYVFEYVPNQYSVTDENLKTSDAIEIKFGQSAKPGMGGHLPGNKVTQEIAGVRGFPQGEDIISPAHFRDILNKVDLKKKVDWLREKSGGRPIGVKFAAGHVEADMEAALYAEPDFITIDGRPGATGAAPKFVKAAAAVPTVFALYRAREYLRKRGVKNVSLVITGGLRVSSDFAKALAMGADAVAIATAALIASACQQYRACQTGKCPVGVTTHDPDLRSRLNMELSAQRLSNYLDVCTEELREFSRLAGHDSIHDLNLADIRTTNSEISNHTGIEHV